MMKRWRWLACIAFALLAAAPAHAGDEQNEDALFASGLHALQEGRTNEAIADLESLGDRGVLDPVVSFDRGLAYAQRVRAGAEQPGDLGRAAQGFEEARELTSDSELANEATRSLAVVRSEVARRRARAGDPAEIEQGPTLRRALTRLASDDAWAIAALVASLIVGASLFVRWLASERHARIGAAIALAVATPMLVTCAIFALFARDDRMHLREGVLVASGARLADDRHIVLASGGTLPEAARVEVLELGPGWTRVRWGARTGWLPSQTVRPIAVPE